MSNLIGKSIFVWDIDSIFQADTHKIAAGLHEAGFQSALVHVSNLSNWRTQKRIDLVGALKEVGIEPIGSAAVFGENPVKDGQFAAAICKDFGLSNFVFDIEGQFDKVEHSPSVAVKLLQALRAAAPQVKIGWCWWAQHHVPNKPASIWHPKEVLWGAMHEGQADFGMPMAYWNWRDDEDAAVAFLEETWRQWREITDKPIIPIGRAYIGDGGTPLPDAMTAFERRARSLGSIGVCWWSMQHALDDIHLPGIWQTLSSLPAFGEPEPLSVTDLANNMRTRSQVEIKFIVMVDGQCVRTMPSPTATEIAPLNMGQVLTGLVDITINSAIDVWIKFSSVGGWVPMLSEGTVCLDRA